MDPTVQVRDRGVLTFPAELREKYGIRSGDTFRLVDLDGIFVLTPMVPMVPELAREISTSLIERVNQTFRHALVPLVRKSRSFCKEREPMKRRVVFFQAFYNFARPHMSLRVAIPKPQRVSQGLFQPKWKQRTPGMAAGLTDHVWTFRELLTAKFEPVHCQSISG